MTAPAIAPTISGAAILFARSAASCRCRLRHAMSGTRRLAMSNPRSKRSMESTGRQVENADDVEPVSRGMDENLFRVGIERPIAVRMGKVDVAQGVTDLPGED